MASAFGLIWASLVAASGMIAIVGLEALERANAATPGRAVDLWLAIDTVRDGLGGGVELVGGLWMVLVGVGSLRGRTLPRTLDALGLPTGLAGCASALLGLAGAGAIFGMGQIVWFVRVGGVPIGASGVHGRRGGTRHPAPDSLPAPETRARARARARAARRGAPIGPR